MKSHVGTAALGFRSSDARPSLKSPDPFFDKLRQMSATTQPVPNQRARIESIDVVRGVIMILMALDHTRDFFGNSGLNPTDPAATTIPLFFTRWITHFCAPVFFLLTGTGAFLSLRKKSKAELSRFLCTRGLWLIFLELVVSRGLGWQFNFDYHVVFIIVLWALGWAMIVLSGLVYLPSVGGCSVRGRDDRDPQFVRFRAIFQLALDHPALAQFSRERADTFRVRGVSADSVDWGYRGGLRTRTRSIAGPRKGAGHCCFDWASA